MSERASIHSLPTPETEPESVKWLALVLAEMFRHGITLIAKRYPEARGKCANCGKRA